MLLPAINPNLNLNLSPAVAASPDVAAFSVATVAASSLPSLRPRVDPSLSPKPDSNLAVAAAPGGGDSFPAPTHTPAAAAAADTIAVTVTMTTPTPSPTASPTTSPTPAGPYPGSPTDGGGDGRPTECRLLGSFAILVQLALGALALLSLVYKRWRERPQRPVRIWWFDVSKQVFGSVLVHAANVFMSMLTSGRFNLRVNPVVVGGAAVVVRRALEVGVRLGMMALGSRGAEGGDGSGSGGGSNSGDDGGVYVPNPCSFYLLNLAIDVSAAPVCGF
jgi:hypothetical protein